MKRAPLLVLAGTVAGFIGVLSFHTRPAGLVTSGAPAGGGTYGGTPAATPKATPTGHAPAGRGTVRTALGAEESFNFGVLDVQVTVRGTRITDVSVPTLQVAELTSQQSANRPFLFSGPRRSRPRAPGSTEFPAPRSPARPTPSPCRQHWTSCTTSDPLRAQSAPSAAGCPHGQQAGAYGDHRGQRGARPGPGAARSRRRQSRSRREVPAKLAGLA